jgi:hypothetical protein
MSAIISGTDLGGATAFMVSGAGVTATLETGATTTDVPLRITLAAEASQGPRTISFSVGSSTIGVQFNVVSAAALKKRGQITSQ